MGLLTQKFHGLLSWTISLILIEFSLISASASASGTTSTIIVGAGMSGIMAAKTLSDKGVKDFVILEATNRIGGRMHKKTFAGHTVEVGANWVEGVGGDHMNPIWALAKKHNLRTFYSDYDNVSFNIYHQNVPKSPLEMAIDFYFYDFEIAEPPRVTSLKNVEPIATFDTYGEDEYFVADSRGYEYLLHKIAEEFLKSEKGSIIDNRLNLNKVVQEIQYTNESVKVLTEDGSIYTANYIIVSTSIGVLQTKLIKFKPDLPQWKILSIFKWDMVIYTKIFMKFPFKFWPTGLGTEFFIYAHEKRGYYNFWQHLENEYPGANLLMVTVTDDESRRIEQQDDNETKAEAMAVLRNMFGNHIPDAEEILVPKWGRDRFYCGTYSNWPIGVSTKDFNNLKAPIGPVYFTGEHTSQDDNGYVHGAYLAGIDTANMLLSCINEGDCAHPSHRQNVDKNASYLVDIQREREIGTQAWMEKVQVLEDALSTKCNP